VGEGLRSWKILDFKKWGLEPRSLTEVYACGYYHAAFAGGRKYSGLVWVWGVASRIEPCTSVYCWPVFGEEGWNAVSEWTSLSVYGVVSCWCCVTSLLCDSHEGLSAAWLKPAAATDVCRLSACRYCLRCAQVVDRLSIRVLYEALSSTLKLGSGLARRSRKLDLYQQLSAVASILRRHCSTLWPSTLIFSCVYVSYRIISCIYYSYKRLTNRNFDTNKKARIWYQNCHCSVMEYWQPSFFWESATRARPVFYWIGCVGRLASGNGKEEGWVKDESGQCEGRRGSGAPSRQFLAAEYR